MSDEAFSRAARAVRMRYDGTSPASEATRLRITRGTELRRRRRLVAYVLPLAAVLAASAAWGAATGRLSWVLSGTKGGTPASTPGDVRGARVTPPARATQPDTAPGNGEPSSPVPAATPGGADPQPAPPPRDSAEGHASEPPLPRRAPAPSSSHVRPATADAEESLYAVAHRAHFVDHDSSAALRGWDAYLATYPSGRFALEARYNRALALVRLQKRDEARAALAPFADGTYGGYRQREAGELLDALAGQ